MSSAIYHGDCVEIMRTIDSCSIDSIVCDPPYGLSDHRPDDVAACLSAWLAGEPYLTKKKGFMGKTWDSWVPGPEVWRECYRVLKPGGHIIAFAGSRTHDLMSIAMRLAGFECRDTVMWEYSQKDAAAALFDSMTHDQKKAFAAAFPGEIGVLWQYGAGFPKSMDVSKQLDKHGGKSVSWFGPWFRKWREENGVTQKQVAALFPSKTGNLTGCVANWELGLNMPTPEQFNLIRDTFGLPFDSVEAAEREVVGRSEATAATGGVYGEYGKGFDITAPATDSARQWAGWGTSLKPAFEPALLFRKPLSEGTVAANVLAHGTGALNIDGCRVAGNKASGSGQQPFSKGGVRQDTGAPAPNARHGDFDTNSGRWPANLILEDCDEVRAVFPVTGPSKASMRGEKTSDGTHAGWARESHKGFDSVRGHDDAGGSAARFFHQFSHNEDDVITGQRLFYSGKASKRDRDEGLEHMEAVHRPNGNKWTDTDYRVLNGDRNEGREAGPRKNIHPTVKPTDLMRYLCRLVTPPGGVVLDPFMGSGSTGKAAILEGFSFVGIEREAEYVEIARARIQHAQKQCCQPKQNELFPEVVQ